MTYYASRDSAGMVWGAADADLECAHGGRLPGDCRTVGCLNNPSTVFGATSVSPAPSPLDAPRPDHTTDTLTVHPLPRRPLAAAPSPGGAPEHPTLTPSGVA